MKKIRRVETTEPTPQLILGGIDELIILKYKLECGYKRTTFEQGAWAPNCYGEWEGTPLNNESVSLLVREVLTQVDPSKDYYSEELDSLQKAFDSFPDDFAISPSTIVRSTDRLQAGIEMHQEYQRAIRRLYRGAIPGQRERLETTAAQFSRYQQVRRYMQNERRLSRRAVPEDDG